MPTAAGARGTNAGAGYALVAFAIARRTRTRPAGGGCVGDPSGPAYAPRRRSDVPPLFRSVTSPPDGPTEQLEVRPARRPSGLRSPARSGKPEASTPRWADQLDSRGPASSVLSLAARAVSVFRVLSGNVVPLTDRITWRGFETLRKHVEFDAHPMGASYPRQRQFVTCIATEPTAAPCSFLCRAASCANSSFGAVPAPGSTARVHCHGGAASGGSRERARCGRQLPAASA